MRPGIAISGVTHAVVLGWGLVLFAVTPIEAPRTESMPVDLVPISELTELKAGTLKKTNVEEPKKQVAEKVAEPKPTPPIEAKPAEKPEVKPTAAAPPPPPPPPNDALEKLIDKMVTPEPAPAQVRVPEPPKRPPIPKQQPKPAEATADARAPQRTFDPNRVAALLDKRDPTRPRAAAPEVSPHATLGAPTGFGQRLSQGEMDALRAKISECWNPPAGAKDAEKLTVLLRIQFKPDGTLLREPELMNRGSGAFFQVAAEAARRAVLRCQPYTMLSPSKYDVWKDIEINFDPQDMYQG